MPNLQTPSISDDHLRTAIPNLPKDARFIEVKPTNHTQKSEVWVRETPTTWRPAVEAQPIVQPAAIQAPVLWLTTTVEGEYRILTQLAPPDSGQNSWGWPEEGPFAINPAENISTLDDLLSNNPQLVIINNRGKLFPREWVERVKKSGRPYVIVTPESPNKGFLGIKSAAELGGQPVRSNAVRILSALPKLDNWWSSYWELRRMKLSQKDVWEKLSVDIKSQNLPAPINEASSADASDI